VLVLAKTVRAAYKENVKGTQNMKTIKLKLILALSSAVWAVTVQAYSFKVKVDIGEVAETNAVKMAIPKGSEKPVNRYFRFAERTHPLVLTHGFAALPDQGGSEFEEDPLESLDDGTFDTDAIQKVDKDVEYVIRANGSRSSFVLMIINRKKENLTAEIELKRGRMFEPVYRRVYSEDGGKTWTTMAWQPPRAADLYPWPIEVPANTIQTVTIILR
jgi:hypothetical protein